MPCWKLAMRSLVCAAVRAGAAAGAAALTPPGTRFAPAGTQVAQGRALGPARPGRPRGHWCLRHLGRLPPLVRGRGPAGRTRYLARHRGRPVAAEPAAPEPVRLDGLEDGQPVLRTD